MEANQISSNLREFVGGFVRGATFSNEDDIFQRGFVNSLFAMQLILYVESTFGVTVQNEDMDIANFSSIAALTRFVLSKRDAHAGA